MPKLLNLKAGVAQSNDIVENVVIASADGAITIQPCTVVITKASAAALTIASPTAAQNGTIIRFVTVTAAAHTVTYGTVGFNDSGTSGDVATFTAAKGNGFAIVAYEGKWYTLYLNNVALG